MLLTISFVAIVTATATSSGADIFAIIWRLLKWVGYLSPVLVFIMFASWRWISWVQRLIFPYLGGRWKGSIIFQVEDREETRDVTLHVKHTPFSIKLFLESEESLSKTLVVQASKSNDLDDDDKLYYVYLNSRKEGVPKEFRSYRGVAILRVKTSDSLVMVGDYFTESSRRGHLHFDVVKLNPWWVLWK